MMDNIKQQRSDKFWTTYFPEWVGQPMTEREALDSNFWTQYQYALTMTDADTVYAIVYAKPAIQIKSGEVYIRIVKTAKQMWHKKTDSIYDN